MPFISRRLAEEKETTWTYFANPPNSMKYEAIVNQGIEIGERVPIPDDMIPADSRVEIDAKIHAGWVQLYWVGPEEKIWIADIYFF